MVLLYRCRSRLRYLFIMAVVLAFGFTIPLSSMTGLGVDSVFAAPDALSGAKTICASGGDYATIRAAITAITSQGLDGPLVLELCASYTSSSESFPLTFTAFTGSSATNTVTIRPAAGATGLSITSSTSTIYLNGATYVIIDGRPGGSGDAQELTISNTNINSNTVLFANDASQNTLQYLNIEGINSSTSTGGGVVNFSSTTGSTGNDNNTFDHCNLHGGSSKPTYVIYSAGTSGKGNSGNTISNNHIYDFFNASGTSRGIGIAINSPGWTITGNSIYQTSTLTPTTAITQYAIYINSGDGYTITNNVIGGSQPDGGGSPFTIDSSSYGTKFYGIYASSMAVTNASTIQGNTIANISLSASGSGGLYGIFFDVGKGELIDNSIYDLSSATVKYGIYLGDARETTVNRNQIVLAGEGNTFTQYGIYFYGGSGTVAAVTLANNQISINPTTSASQNLYGINDASYAGNTLNAYHNTVYIGGTASGSSSWAFKRNSSKTDTVTLKNNIFFNNRSGGSVNHFAAGNQSSASAITSDYNLFVGTGTTAASFMDWGTSSSGTPVTFAAWQSGSGGDSHSYAGTAIDILATDLFTDPANNDFSIITGSGFDAPPLASNRGVAGTGVTDDFNGVTRNTFMPDLGAYEFSVDRTGLTGPNTLAGGWGYYDTLGIDSGTVTAGSNVYVNTATVASGATLDMSTHFLTITNGQDVTGASDFSFQDLNAVTGVQINPGDTYPLGLTLGSIKYMPSGATSCSAGGQTAVRRCFRIDPTNATGRNATVRFYFDENTDLNGLTCANLKAYHYDGSDTWSLAGGTGGTATCNGANSYIEVTGVANFSSFALADPERSPTAIILQDFNTATPPFAALGIFLGLLLIVCAWLAFRQFIKKTPTR